jgi:hypothetical protein
MKEELAIPKLCSAAMKEELAGRTSLVLEVMKLLRGFGEGFF